MLEYSWRTHKKTIILLRLTFIFFKFLKGSSFSTLNKFMRKCYCSNWIKFQICFAKHDGCVVISGIYSLKKRLIYTR